MVLFVLALGFHSPVLGFEDDELTYSLVSKLHDLESQAKAGGVSEGLKFVLGSSTKADVLAWKSPEYVDKAGRLIYFEEGVAFLFEAGKNDSEALLMRIDQRLSSTCKLTYSKLKSVFGAPDFEFSTDTNGTWKYAVYCMYNKKHHVHLKFYNDVREVADDPGNTYESTVEMSASDGHCST